MKCVFSDSGFLIYWLVICFRYSCEKLAILFYENVIGDVIVIANAVTMDFNSKKFQRSQIQVLAVEYRC